MVARAEGVVCREEELDELRLLLGIPAGLPVHGVFVYGDSGTGKTHCVKHLLRAHRHVYINCIEVLQARCVFSSILNRLKFDSKLQRLEDCSELITCDNHAEFVRLFQQVFDDEEPLYLIFDAAHRLKEMDLIAFFARLQEISGRSVCSIFISSVFPSHLLSNSDYNPPHEVYFANYSHEQICEVLVESRPFDCEAALYNSYCQLVLSVFKNVTTNVKELMHIASSNFPHYMEPFAEGSEQPPSSLKLWRNIEPHLKTAMSTVYLRDSDAQRPNVGDDKENAVVRASAKQIIELPFFSKFLLIASYLASYNPPSTDKKFFVKRSNRERRKTNHFRREKPNYHLLGPRPFPLNRMLAIFHAIIETPVQPTAVLFSQISSLVHHKLILQVPSKDPLNNPRFKCSVDLDYVTTIANTVKFAVTQHLEDFNM